VGGVSERPLRETGGEILSVLGVETVESILILELAGNLRGVSEERGSRPVRPVREGLLPS